MLLKKHMILKIEEIDLLTLRPEGTAGVVRSYIENKMYGTHNLPVKVYYNGTMYRYERPQIGSIIENLVNMELKY